MCINSRISSLPLTFASRGTLLVYYNAGVVPWQPLYSNYAFLFMSAPFHWTDIIRHCVAWGARRRDSVFRILA